jgi:hypothetical protein
MADRCLPVDGGRGGRRNKERETIRPPSRLNEHERMIIDYEIRKA